jgi:hypothetical protein
MNRAFRLSNAAPERSVVDRIMRGWLPRGWIDGLVLANNAGDATNDIDIAAGVARSTATLTPGGSSTLAADQHDLELTAAVTKQLDVAWAPGSGGGRSGSALANGTWHAFLIGGRGLKSDVLFHDSISTIGAALPGGYTAWRRVGSILRESAAIVAFVQDGDFFQRTPVQDINANNPGTSAVSRTLSVPTGINVLAELAVELISNNGANTYALFLDLAIADTAPTTGKAQMVSGPNTGGGALRTAGTLRVRTNTSAQIRSRLSSSDANTGIQASTLGWWDVRGRDA